MKIVQDLILKDFKVQNNYFGRAKRYFYNVIQVKDQQKIVELRKVTNPFFEYMGPMLETAIILFEKKFRQQLQQTVPFAEREDYHLLKLLGDNQHHEVVRKIQF